jgi:hypothetical protein
MFPTILTLSHIKADTTSAHFCQFQLTSLRQVVYVCGAKSTGLIAKTMFGVSAHALHLQKFKKKDL